MGNPITGKLIPPGFASLREVDIALAEHQARLSNSIRFTDVDNSVSVAIIDSTFKPSANFLCSENIGRKRRIIPGDDDDTTGHGGAVASTCAAYTDHAVYNFYQVVQSGGSVLERHLIQGIGYAHLEDRVDIINLSVGNDHSDDGNGGCASHNQPCKLREAASSAISDGVHIVAAAGNSGQYDSVCCPSLHDLCISVGGFLSKCLARIDADNETTTVGLDRETRPPFGCWLGNDSDGPVLCSGNDCSLVSNHSCEDCREIVNWSGNVDPVRNKPDILAPAGKVIYLDPPQIVPATSWAAPFVTSIAVELIAGARSKGETVEPYRLRRAFNDTAISVDGQSKRINAEGALFQLFDKLNLSRPTASKYEGLNSIGGP